MQEMFDAVKAFRETKSRRWQQLRMLVPVLLLLVGAFWARNTGLMTEGYLDVDFVYIAAALLILGGLIYTLAHWRCPGCRKLLWHRINPRYCPGCGIVLRK